MSTPRLLAPALAALILFTCWPSPSWAQESSAAQFVERMLKARETAGFRARIQAVIGKSSPGKSADLRLLIRGRQDNDLTQILYQALWPKPLKGEALVLNLSKKSGLSGFQLKPPEAVEQLPSIPKNQSFFNTQLTVEEVAENFWYWPTKKFVGKDTLLGHECWIVELRPPRRNVSSYAAVKVWISPKILLPLRIQKLYSGERLALSINSEKIVQHGDLWVTSVFTVVPADQRPSTTFKFLSGEQDPSVPPELFTPQGFSKTYNQEGVEG